MKRKITMDVNKQELAAVQVAAIEATEVKRELNELELALVGGGWGDVSLG
jgi:hypothetical protein